MQHIPVEKSPERKGIAEQTFFKIVKMMADTDVYSQTLQYDRK
jgi:hypothetical protein